MLTRKRHRLSKTRRKRQVPEGWVTAETIETFKPTYTSMALYPGGKSLALDNTGDLVLVGGGDGSAGIHSISQNKLIHALEGAHGQITDTLWWGDRAILSTASGEVLIFENGSEAARFESHAGSVTALALHPTGEILASVGVDKSYVFYDLNAGKPITQIYGDHGKTPGQSLTANSGEVLTWILGLTTASFHPDGHIFAVGTSNGQIQIFDVKSGSIAATFNSTGPIKSISFSENGTWLATASEGQTSVTIWNLRTTAELRQLEIGSEIESIRWDYTGQFLAAAGPSGVTVQSYSKSTKEWSEPLKSAVPAIAIEWGPRGSSLVTVSGGGTITVLGAGG